jgi:hypothetical protein
LEVVSKLPAVIDLQLEQEYDASRPFSPAHREKAFRKELEMCVGMARQLLYRHPNDCFATPVILERRQEAAAAILDLVWALMAEQNALDGEPTPLPALIAFNEKVLRRRRLRRPA